MHRWIALTSALWFCTGEGLTYAEGGFPVRIGQSGEYLELEYSNNGQIVKDHLPLYRAGNVRYFTAGVGLEERQAEYPPFSLKLIFTAGGKPYLSGVDVLIQPLTGGAVIKIPNEQIQGPWLFVDLPSGTYDIVATYGGQTRSSKGVTITAGKSKTLYLRWAQDAGVTVPLPNE
ncbi:MAG TPA: hypothetical protein VJR03_04270 [Nitrospira sp.]|nr:hypothetical protein [Nitrospira sp.]